MEAVSDTDPEQNLSLPALTFRPQPTTVEETGLDDSQCVDLVLKTLRSGGRLSGGEIANRLCLSFRIIETILNFLKQELMIETVAAAAVTEQQFEYSLTSKGNEKAAEALERNEYIGPAPVSLRDCVEVFNQQSVRDQKVTPDAVRDALSDLELDHDFHRHLGAAVNGGHSILLYGKPGNGKSSVAKRLVRMLGGMVLIPHALDISGQTVRVFDSRVHSPIDIAPQEEDPLTPAVNYQKRKRDQRWVSANRPLVITGGELTSEDLEMRYSPQSKFYLAPVQMLANSGILVIDDFGRQRVNPHDLLNRWTIPLEDGTDHYSLTSGETFEVPFNPLVVFSTNLRPEDLGDEAFWRRIRHKVELGNPSEEAFLRILKTVCEQNSIQFSDIGGQYLLETHYKARGRPLRAVHPRDLVRLMMDMGSFEGTNPELTPRWLDAACASYFTEDSQTQKVS